MRKARLAVFNLGPGAIRRRVSFVLRKGRALARGASPESLRHWAEIALFAIAFLCLGTWAWSYLDSHVYQAYETWRFERALAARPAAPSAPLSPAPQDARRPAELPADAGSPVP